MKVYDFYKQNTQEGLVNLSALSMDNKEMVQDISFAHFSTLVLEESMSALQEGQLTAFDAVVGETNCQIRAVKIATLYNDIFVAGNGEMQRKITALKQRCLEAKQSLSVLKAAREKLCTIKKRELKKRQLEGTLDEEQCSALAFDFKSFAHTRGLLIDHDLFFALLAYILTVVKAEGDEQTDHKPLTQEKYALKANKAKELVRRCKVLLSQLSADYTAVLARTQSAFLAAVCADVRVSKNNSGGKDLCCPPCFHTMKVLFDHAENEQTPIVLKLFQRAQGANKLLGSTCFYTGQGSWKNRAAVIVEGATDEEDVERILPRIKDIGGIKEVILMEAAAHPQYTAEYKCDLPIDAEAQKEIAEYAARARDVGCCRDNPHLCVPEHIFANLAWKESA